MRGPRVYADSYYVSLRDWFVKVETSLASYEAILKAGVYPTKPEADSIHVRSS